jgi:exodeoxyribonuclease VII large subunit
MSLSALNGMISGVIRREFGGTYWISAETSDVRTTGAAGHCYLEFIEKGVLDGKVIAKSRGTIWNRTLREMFPLFERVTGQVFRSGIKVLVRVSVEFHEQYGFSLTVREIDPSYTVGDMLKKRLEIIGRLESEGIKDLNKGLELPLMPCRIAVITSETAAGYGDFMDQLLRNAGGYPFYLKLYPSLMQGDRTTESIISALDRISAHASHFDAVVIIRGGGSTSDLSSFDTYALSSHCAQFPLPLITGIGHERDDTIVDLVAHTRLKTPTAVASFLISRMDIQRDLLSTLSQQLVRASTGLITLGREHLVSYSDRLRRSVDTYLSNQSRELDLRSQYISMISPDRILSRGYSLVRHGGTLIKLASALVVGDEIELQFADGKRVARIVS